MQQYKSIVSELSRRSKILGSAIAALEQYNGGSEHKPRKRGMSPAARRRISAAMKAAWRRRKRW
jgi:hypothetical protein